MSSSQRWILISCGILIPLVGFIVHHRLVRHDSSGSAHRSAIPYGPQFIAAYGQLPLSFEHNQGHADSSIQFLAHGPRQAIALTSNEAILELPSGGEAAQTSKATPSGLVETLGSVMPNLLKDRWAPTIEDTKQSVDTRLVRIVIAGARPDVQGIGIEKLPGKANYLLGNDSRQWKTNIATYSKVKFEGVYPGIDLIYYGNQEQLEDDFVVNPGSNPKSIKLSFQGVEKVQVDKSTGDLVLNGDRHADELRLRKPLIYQLSGANTTVEEPGDRQFVDGEYSIDAQGRVGFEIAKYDGSKPLVIDPVVSYFTYLGGMLPDFALRVAVDSLGDAYVTGATVSPNFPVSGALRSTLLVSVCGQGFTGSVKSFPCPDAFVTKLNATGTAAIYSTYLGGSRSDMGIGITVDSSGNAYVVGETESQDFPVTPTAFQTTLLAGGPGNHVSSAFLTKLSATGSQILYSTYLGATSPVFAPSTFASAVAADNSGNAYVVGFTRAQNFPTTAGVIQPSMDGISCPYMLAFGAVGYNSTASVQDMVGVSAPAGCNWSATSNSAWLTVTSGSSGSGNGTVSFTVAANTGVGRAGTITIAGQDFDVAQVGVSTCSSGITLSPQFGHVGIAGGTLDVNVSAPSGCSWTSTSGVPWITITSGSSGSGNGAVSFSVSPSTARLGRVALFIIAEKLFSLGQNGSCNYLGCSDGFVSKLNTSASGNASLVYSTYLGGSTFDAATSVAIDANGNAYVAGGTLSSNFPTLNAFQAAPAGSSCGPPWRHTCASAFLTRLNPTATAVLFSTYIGGSADNAATAVALDTSDNAYVTGFTNSTDFPVSPGVVQPLHAAASCFFGTLFVECPDAFVAKFSSSGSRLYSTYLGGTGTDLGLSIVADSEGNAYVTGTTNSTNFPTSNPFQASPGGGTCSFRGPSPARTSFTFTCPDVFVSELNSTGSALVFSSYLGGNEADLGTGIALDSSGNIYVTGATMSRGLATAGALQASPSGMGDAFVAKISTAAADFSLSIAAGSSSSATVSAGNTAAYNLQVNPIGGFSGPVALSCTGAPAQAVCTPSTSPLSVSGTAAVPFIVDVTTNKCSMVPPDLDRQLKLQDPNQHNGVKALLLAIAILLCWFVVGRRSNAIRSFVRTAMLVVGLALLSTACGSSPTSMPTPPPTCTPTPTGNSTLTVTGTSGSVSHTQTLTLTVN
jgi:hypothetical protein